jgi:DNA-binding response OmpR family regulator
MKNSKQTILVVDDAVENLDLVANLLNDRYRIQVATNGEKALEIVNNDLPDLILLDIMMPGMNGYEVIKKLKSNPETKKVPVIFLTAKNEIKDIVKGFENGSVDYIPKPFNIVELESRVNAHMTIKRQQDLLRVRNAEYKELLHILCHDLNNTLSILKMAVDYVDMDVQENSLDEYKTPISIAVNNGIDVISLVREMCRLEEYRIIMSPLNLFDLFIDAEILMKKKLEDKNLSLLIDIPEEITVLGEKRSLLNSVIINLLTNAIKFSEPGSSIIIKSREISHSRIKFSITDAGIGIPEDLLNNIFNISKSNSRRGTVGELGTGFGMPMVKKFIELYNGTIDIKSKDIEKYPDDHGTEITITLQGI